MDFDSLIDDEYNDVKSLFFDHSDQNPENTRIIIENELRELISQEFPKTKSYNIVLTERKGLFLFHPLLRDLQHNGVSSVKLFNLENNREIKGMFIRNQVIFKEKPETKIVILTDAIGLGNELDELLAVYNVEWVEKVVGYLAKKEGYDKLKAKYPTVNFCFKRPVENSMYFAEQRRLQTVYQSRMERIDEEHPLGKIKIKPTISIDVLCGLIQESMSSFYDGEIQYADDNLAISTVGGYTVTFWDVTNVLNKEFGISLNHMKLDRVQLRFRYCKETSCLSIMGLALPDSCTSHLKFNLYRAIIGRCHLTLPFRLCRVIIPISNTTKSKILGFLNKRWPHPFCDIYCPYCVDLNVSNDLSTRFFEAFSEKMKGENFNLTLLGPFDNCE